MVCKIPSKLDTIDLVWKIADLQEEQAGKPRVVITPSLDGIDSR